MNIIFFEKGKLLEGWVPFPVNIAFGLPLVVKVVAHCHEIWTTLRALCLGSNFTVEQVHGRVNGTKSM